MPHKHSEQGNLYHVGIRLTVPTKVLVVSREPAERESHQQLDVAITDAFQAMGRKLEDYAEQMRDDTAGTRRNGSGPGRWCG